MIRIWTLIALVLVLGAALPLLAQKDAGGLGAIGTGGFDDGWGNSGMGGGFGGDGVDEFNLRTIVEQPLKAMGLRKYKTSKNLVLAMSEKGDRLFGYSRQLEKWAVLKLETPLRNAVPNLGADVGCISNTIQKGDEDQTRFIWAYSSKNGTWDKLTLPLNSKAYPTIVGDKIVLNYGRDSDSSLNLVFSNLTGKWAPPTDGLEEFAQVPATSAGSEPAAVSPTKDTPSIVKIFHLKHSSATDIATILQQLFRGPNVSIVADTRTNSVIIKGPENLQSAIGTLAQKLDEEPARASSPATNAPSVPERNSVDNKPLDTTRSGTASAKSDDKLWQPDLASARAEASRLGRPLLIHFHAAWCAVCLQTSKDILRTDDMKRALSDRVVGVKIDIDQHPDITEKYGIEGIPANLLLGPDGNVISTTVGFQPTRSYLQKIAEAERAYAADLKEKYHKEEQNAEEFARQLRDGGGSDSNLKTKLRETVTKAFSLRQEMHKAELAAFQQRMADVQQKIEAREKIKDEVIEHRFQELLNPSLQWKASGTPSPSPSPQVTSAAVKNSEVNELDGSWQWISSSRNPEMAKDFITGTIRDGIFTKSNKRNEIFSYPIRLDSQSSPKQIELSGSSYAKGTSQGTYRLEGDRLTINWGARESEVWKKIKGNEFISLHFSAPKGAAIAPLDVYSTANALLDEQQLPVCRKFVTGRTHQLKLSSIPDFPDLQLAVSIELPTTSPTLSFWSTGAHQLDLQFTTSDFLQIRTAGNLTKAIYLADAKSNEPPRGIETLSTNEFNAKRDIVAEADQSGTVLAVARISTQIANEVGKPTEGPLKVPSATTVINSAVPNPGVTTVNTREPSATTESVVLKGDTRLILKGAQEFQKQFQDLDRQVRASQLSLDHGRELLKIDKATQGVFDIKQRNYNDSRQQLKLLRAEFDTQLKLLEAEVRSLQKAFKSAAASLTLGQEAEATGGISRLEVQKLQVAAEALSTRLDQATTLLELYRKVVIPTDADAKPNDSQTKEPAHEAPKSK